jgi:hypothetical protein
VRLTEAASFRPPARVAALAAAPTPAGALVVAACVDGSLCRIRLGLPTRPGAGLADVTLASSGGADFDGPDLHPWRPAAHSGAATCVDIDPGTLRVVSGGADGAVVVTPADAPRGAGDGATALAPARVSASVSSVRWAGPHSVAVADAAGGVSLWDERAGGASAAVRAPPPTPATAAACLATTPARPHAIAAGLRDGSVALWDARRLGAGVVASAALAGPARARCEGAATGAAFDAAAELGAEPGLLFTTRGGALASAPLAGLGEAATLLAREPAGAAAALALDAAGGTDVVLATDHECLVYLRRLGGGGVGMAA